MGNWVKINNQRRDLLIESHNRHDFLKYFMKNALVIKISSMYSQKNSRCYRHDMMLVVPKRAWLTEGDILLIKAYFGKYLMGKCSSGLNLKLSLKSFENPRFIHELLWKVSQMQTVLFKETLQHEWVKEWVSMLANRCGCDRHSRKGHL